jgi:hypothetical protein
MQHADLDGFRSVRGEGDERDTRCDGEFFSGSSFSLLIAGDVWVGS